MTMTVLSRDPANLRTELPIIDGRLVIRLTLRLVGSLVPLPLTLPLRPPLRIRPPLLGVTDMVTFIVGPLPKHTRDALGLVHTRAIAVILFRRKECLFMRTGSLPSDLIALRSFLI